MTFRKFDNHKPYFRGVALATLLAGAVLAALGGAELILNLWSSYTFTSPVFKIMGGLAVMSLGYIHLELEMMRVK